MIRSQSQVLESLLQKLQLQECFISYPILLPVLLAEPLFEASQERLSGCHQRLDKSEEAMGQHEYEERPKGNPLEMDFTSATRSLNWIGNKIGVDILRLRQTLIALEKLSLWGRSLCALRDGEPSCLISDTHKIRAEALEKVTFYIDSCHILLLEAYYEEKRVRTLIQVVYQFMAQKDSKVNIRLAESSAIMAKAGKKDSSAMKTIALLGMLFLPGTFVAAVFSMPVFDWAASDGTPLVNKGFSIYWAITAPLTFCVFMIWLLAMVLLWESWSSRSRELQVREVEFKNI